MADRLVLACYLAPNYSPAAIERVLDGRYSLAAVAPHWERDLRMRTPAVRRAEHLAHLIRAIETDGGVAGAAP